MIISTFQLLCQNFILTKIYINKHIKYHPNKPYSILNTKINVKFKEKKQTNNLKYQRRNIQF